MQRTPINPQANAPQPGPYPTLQTLLSQSEDGFYGSLQRIWNNVLQVEDLGFIQQEADKFVYAYRFAEAELQRVYSASTVANTTPQTN